MSRFRTILSFALAILLIGGGVAEAQRRGGGGARGGGRMGGGMSRPMARPSGGMSRPASRPTNIARPSVGASRPNISQRPNIGASRPNIGASRPNVSQRPVAPGGGMTRPNIGSGSNGLTRPNIGARPSNPGGNLANRPGLGGAINRPGTGNIAANRPSISGGGGANRPTTLPGGGNITRPGGGSGIPGGANRPGGANTLPGIANRPGGGGSGLPGGANRPGGGATTLPGVINRPGAGGGGTQWPGTGGNRPGGGGIAGGGNRPGGGGIGPNRPGGGGNYPGGGGNRPGGGIAGGGNRPGGNSNFPGLGPNNRPGIGGGNNNNIGNRINTGNIGNRTNINNINNNIVNRPNYGGNNIVAGGWGRPGGWNGGGWGRPGWGGGAWGRPGWGAPGWGGAGWGRPGWGGWYHGSWGMGNFGWGFMGGLGWGLGNSLAWGLTNPFLWSGGMGWGAPFGMYGGYGFGVPMVSTYFPTWGATSLMDWGLDATASDWLASTYSNPYVVQQPIENNTTIVYDYSHPIDVAAPTPSESAVESSQKLFESARDAFKAGDYARALSLTDQALPQSPNDPVTHEFRALNLFALGRYDEAAQVIYAVLNAGPGWDWSTLVSLYGNADDYTTQLRSLEAAVKAKPDSAPLQFLLGYHYMVQGFTDAARGRFEKVAQLSPNDKLAAQFAKALAKAQEAKDQPEQPADGADAANANPEPMTPPPANLIGIWKTQPADGQTITLSLRADGTYTWSASSRGRTQSIEGKAGFKDGVLALTQEDGSPLTGKVTPQGNDGFTLQLGEQADAPKLTFTKG